MTTIFNIIVIYLNVVTILMLTYSMMSKNPKYEYSKQLNLLIIITSVIYLWTLAIKKPSTFDMVMAGINIFLIYTSCKRMGTNYKSEMYDEDDY